MLRAAALLVFGSLLGSWAVGQVRAQLVAPGILRLDEKGPNGYEDRSTLLVPNRRTVRSISAGSTAQTLTTPQFRLTIPAGATKLEQVRLEIPGLAKSFYASQLKAWPTRGYVKPDASAILIADSPRMAARENTNDVRRWDLSNDARDVYIVVGDVRRRFLDLTGRTPMPPLFAFGFMESRYHPYSEATALDTIKKYRSEGFPLDVFVVDTDWRIGASHGYGVNEKLFPDMPRFVRAAHAEKVKLIFNDHPEPVGTSAQDPKELDYREQGLTSVLGMGVDGWWYDRNWMTHLQTPKSPLALEVWGMSLYHDVIQKFRPEERVFMMSNIEGINNGQFAQPTQFPAHRYPIWWTGDTSATFDFLERGVRHAVLAGEWMAHPYLSEDLGGHIGEPSATLYTRFLQYGALSPICRIHCTAGQTRYPWVYGAESEGIVRDYVKLRYRLLPMIYSAARTAYDSGTPMLRATRPLRSEDDPLLGQYLLGENLLVAPITSSNEPPTSAVPDSLFGSLQAQYFNGRELQGDPVVERKENWTSHDWKEESPAPGVGKDDFSARWTGQIGPMPEGGEYDFETISDDGVRLWIDGKLVVDSWANQFWGRHRGKIRLNKGQVAPIKIEYYEAGGGAGLKINWIKPSQPRPKVPVKSVVLPRGEWIDAWTERSILARRDTVVQESCPLWKTPMFLKSPSITPLADVVESTQDGIFGRITLDVIAGRGKTTGRLYEDDGHSLAYQGRGYRTTQFVYEGSPSRRTLTVRPSQGSFTGAPYLRDWIVRLHLPKGVRANRIKVSVPCQKTMLKPQAGAVMPHSAAGTRPGRDSGGVVEIRVRQIPTNRSWTVTVQ